MNCQLETKRPEKLSIVNVIHQNEPVLSSIKYGIQWKNLSDKSVQTGTLLLSSNIEKSSVVLDQGDTLPLNNQTECVQSLVEKLETHQYEKYF